MQEEINVTLMACRDASGRFTPREMDGTEWQIRAKQAGLTQRMLARIVDRPDNTISRQLRGEFGKVPGDLVAIIVAWEDMPPERRADWMRRVESELAQRK